MQPSFDGGDPPRARRFLSPLEFSEFSGLSLATIHRYLKKGRLPFHQPGGPRSRILIPIDALLALAIVIPALISDEGIATPVSEPTEHQSSDSDRLSGPPPRWTRRIGGAPTREN